MVTAAFSVTAFTLAVAFGTDRLIFGRFAKFCGDWNLEHRLAQELLNASEL